MTMKQWILLGLLSALVACTSAQAPASNTQAQPAADPRAESAQNVRLV
jgi:hypothetical protein